MKKITLNLMSAISSLLLLCAFPLTADTTHIQAGIGYRHDSLTLNVKERTTQNPRAKSNRHFKDLDILLLGTSIKTTLGSWDTYVRAAFDYGFVLNGNLRDNLHLENRQEFSKTRHSNATIGVYLDRTVTKKIKNNSFVWDFDLAFGYPIECGYEGFEGLEICPAVGFTVNRQQLNINKHKDRYTTQIENSDVEMCIEEKCGRLRGTWWSPWIGFDFAYNSFECWNIYGAFEFHVGGAHRKLDTDGEKKYIDNYKRTKAFYGPLVKIGTIYNFCENWYADANITYWKYFSDSNRENLSWASTSVRLDVGYVF